jgi:hypothetical protein
MLQATNFEALPNWQVLVFFSTLVLWWSMMRPAMVRDYDGRRLPANPTARFLFTFLSLLVYVSLVIAFHAFGEVATKIGHSLPMIGGFVDNFKDQAPLLAAISLGGLLQLSFFRDIERSVLVWLHSARHLHADGVALATHLTRSGFTPTEDEKRKNREAAKKYGVYVTDDDDVDGVGLVTFQNWRKVASLLRLLRDWNNEERRILEHADMKLLAEAETAHERKTQLAMTIIKMVEQVGKGGSTSKLLADVLKMLSDTPHVDRAGVAAVEARMRSMLGEDASAAGRPLRLTGEELRNHLGQIEGYFQVEYEMLLQQVSELAAKSVILAGEAAPERLEQLRAFGFEGLGRIEPINFDRILWLFLIVAFGGFLVLFLGSIGSTQQQGSAEGLARFAFVMAAAALIGAIVGSQRRLARAPITPWSNYLLAGIVAAALFVGVQQITQLIKDYLGIQPPAGQQPFTLYRMLPWTLIPLLLTVGVCRLARVPRWPDLPRLEAYHNIWERFLDGVGISGVLLLAYLLAFSLHAPLGIELPKGLQDQMNQPRILPIPIYFPLLGLGFFIGFFVVRDVRRAAHSQIVDLTATQSQATAKAPQPESRAAQATPA